METVMTASLPAVACDDDDENDDTDDLRHVSVTQGFKYKIVLCFNIINIFKIMSM